MEQSKSIMLACAFILAVGACKSTQEQTTEQSEPEKSARAASSESAESSSEPSADEDSSKSHHAHHEKEGDKKPHGHRKTRYIGGK